MSKGRKPTDELSDDGAIAVLKRLAKQSGDAVEQYAKGNRQELAEKEASEKKIIEEFLPRMASREEIEKVAREKMAEMNADASGAGKLTGAVMKAMGGNADGGVVKEVVASLFS